MPNYAQNPTDADLKNLLVASGVWLASFEDLHVGYVAGAIERFEETTGRVPFLAGSSATVYFDAPTAETQYPRTPNGGIRMDLDVPFVAVTAIAINCSIDDPSGSPLTIDRAVFLYPERRDVRRKPIEWLEFALSPGCGRKSVRIDGSPGSVTAWPVDAWNCVLYSAAASMLAAYRESRMGLPVEIKDDEVTHRFSIENLARMGDGFQSKADAAVMRWILVRA